MDYTQTVLKPAAHMAKPRSEQQGQQAVVICDGEGTHLGLQVLEGAFENGMEIMLRVPNLSFLLEGEDTCNFGPLKVNTRQRHAFDECVDKHGLARLGKHVSSVQRPSNLSILVGQI
jgi:hypothetical protein